MPPGDPDLEKRRNEVIEQIRTLRGDIDKLPPASNFAVDSELQKLLSLVTLRDAGLVLESIGGAVADSILLSRDQIRRIRWPRIEHPVAQDKALNAIIELSRRLLQHPADHRPVRQ